MKIHIRHLSPMIYGRAAWILAVLLPSLGRAAGPTSYFYVAPNGSDDWSGQRAAPRRGAH